MPPGARRGPPPGHRSRPSGAPGSSNSPPRRAASTSDRPRGPERPLTEEEKRKRKEYYERKRRDEKSRDEKKKVKAHRDHDLIDKLDETNPFGISLGKYMGSPAVNLPQLICVSPPRRSLRCGQSLA